MCSLSLARAQNKQMKRILDVVNCFKYLFKTVEINLISNLGINLSMSISVDYLEGVSAPILPTSAAIFAKFAGRNSLDGKPFFGEFNGLFFPMLLDLNGLGISYPM